MPANIRFFKIYCKHFKKKMHVYTKKSSGDGQKPWGRGQHRLLGGMTAKRKKCCSSFRDEGERSRESLDVSVDKIDTFGLGRTGKSGHAHDVACYGHQHLGSGVDHDVADVEVEALWNSIEFCIVGE